MAPSSLQHKIPSPALAEINSIERVFNLRVSHFFRQMEPVPTHAEDGRRCQIMIHELSVLHNPKRVVRIRAVDVWDDGNGHQTGAG